jgi:hypothetical protein
MKYFVVFLLFVTIWICLGCLVIYLTRRRTPVLGRGFRLADPAAPALVAGRPLAGERSCCLQVPCSAGCATEHQRLRESLDMDYGRVTAELRKIIEIGSEPDGAYPADLDH